MNKLTYTAFVAFWASVLTLTFAYWLGPASTDADDSVGADAYTLEQVALHASADDCWVAIEGKVYDLTSYIPHHPTPASVIETWCGREATEGMRTKGYGRDHSAQAWAQLDRYLLGQLVP
jgi:cytochrome b involved in lipid metabolism